MLLRPMAFELVTFGTPVGHGTALCFFLQADAGPRPAASHCPDGVRTLLVRYTVKGSDAQRQFRLPQEYGEGPGQVKLAAACAEAGRIRSLAREGLDWPALEKSRV